MVSNGVKVDTKEGYIISTVECIFMPWYGNFETAICLEEFEKWKIVKGYETKEEAIKGHNEIMKMTVEEMERLPQMLCKE